MFRFAHAADLHLDSPFKGIRNTNEDVGEILRQATFAAYDNLIKLCIDREVGALLIAGDVFDGGDHSLPGQKKFFEGLERLNKHGIRAFVCHGNHDPLDSWGAGLPSPENVTRFETDAECVPVYADIPNSPVVCGISYPTREVRQSLLDRFPSRESQAFTIGLLHANVGSHSTHKSYAPCTIEDLKEVGYDYWALGHVHTRVEVHEDQPRIVYPGNTQGLHSNETGARGVYVVDVGDDHRIESMEFVSVDHVRWEQHDLSIQGIESLLELADRLTEAVEGMLHGADGRSLVYRIRLYGRGPTSTALAQPDNIDDLVQELNSAWAVRQPFAFCGAITSEARSEIDRGQLRKGTDFIGDFLKCTDELIRGAELVNTLRQELEPLFENSRVKRHLDHLVDTTKDAKALIEAAEDAALDLMVTDESDSG